MADSLLVIFTSCFQTQSSILVAEDALFAPFFDIDRRNRHFPILAAMEMQCIGGAHQNAQSTSYAAEFVDHSETVRHPQRPKLTPPDAGLAAGAQIILHNHLKI